jgi:hypothetical protein
MGPSERQRAMVTASAARHAEQKRNVPSSDHPSRCTALGTRHRKGLLSESSCWGTSSHSLCDRSLGKRPFMANHAQNDMARQEKEERGGCPNASAYLVLRLGSLHGVNAPSSVTSSCTDWTSDTHSSTISEKVLSVVTSAVSDWAGRREKKKSCSAKEGVQTRRVEPVK